MIKLWAMKLTQSRAVGFLVVCANLSKLQFRFKEKKRLGRYSNLTISQYFCQPILPKSTSLPYRAEIQHLNEPDEQTSAMALDGLFACWPTKLENEASLRLLDCWLTAESVEPLAQCKGILFDLKLTRSTPYLNKQGYSTQALTRKAL